MILITGATGLIGRFIANDLLEKEVAFKALKRTGSVIPQILQNHAQKEHINWVDGDINDFLGLEEAFEDVDEIIHCAAIVSYHKEDHSRMWQTNVQGTINLLNWAQAKKLKRFVYISSVAALGRGTNGSTVNESTQWYRSPNNTYYAETKYAAEVEVWRASEEGLPVLILNPSVVLGPSDWESSSTRIFKYVWDQSPFYPKGFLNYIDVRDVSSIVLRLMELGISGEKYILNGGTIAYKQAFNLIASSFSRKPPSRELQNWMISIAPFIGRIQSLVTGKKTMITQETARISLSKVDFSNEKIKSFLNFEFKPLEDTIVWTCKELEKFKS